MTVQSNVEFQMMLQELEKVHPELRITTADKAEVEHASASQGPPTQISPPIFAPQAPHLVHPSNQFESRRIRTPRIPRGPRRNKPNPYGYSYKELDDPRETCYRQSQSQQVSALDYDEPPPVQDATPSSSAAAQVSFSIRSSRRTAFKRVTNSCLVA
jgi:hypothetical protein